MSHTIFEFARKTVHEACRHDALGQPALGLWKRTAAAALLQDGLGATPEEITAMIAMWSTPAVRQAGLRLVK